MGMKSGRFCTQFGSDFVDLYVNCPKFHGKGYTQEPGMPTWNKFQSEFSVSCSMIKSKQPFAEAEHHLAGEIATQMQEWMHAYKRNAEVSIVALLAKKHIWTSRPHIHWCKMGEQEGVGRRGCCEKIFIIQDLYMISRMPKIIVSKN